MSDTLLKAVFGGHIYYSVN